MPDEFISRTEALAAAKEWVNEAIMAPMMRTNRLLDKLQKVPAADVAPVVHGQWTPLPSMAPEYACSVCERDYTWGELEEAPYCPNCGARMDGKTE